MALLLHAVYVYMRRNDRSQQTPYSKETELYRILFERSFFEWFNFQHCCICYVFAADKRKYLLILKKSEFYMNSGFFLLQAGKNLVILKEVYLSIIEKILFTFYVCRFCSLSFLR